MCVCIYAFMYVLASEGVGVGQSSSCRNCCGHLDQVLGCSPAPCDPWLVVQYCIALRLSFARSIPAPYRFVSEERRVSRHLPIVIASLSLLLSGFARCSAKDRFSVSSFSGVACEGLSPIVCNCFVIFPIWRAIRRNCVAEVALVKLILRRCHPSRLWAWWRAYTWYTGFGGRASHVLVLAVTPLMASGFHGFCGGVNCVCGTSYRLLGGMFFVARADKVVLLLVRLPRVTLAAVVCR